MTHLLAPLRYNRDVDTVRRAVRRLMDGQRSGAFTEARRFHGVLQLDGFRLIHHRGSQGQPECALLVDADDFVDDLGAIRLSDVPIPRRGGWLTYAVGADTRSRGGILGVHMPSGVEGRTGFRDDHPGQVKAYRAAIGALRQYIAESPGINEVHADWNLHAELPWVREYFARHFPDFVIVASSTGTYKARVIDWALVRKGHGDWAASTVPNPASDHEAVIFTRQEAPVGHLPRNLPEILRARGLVVVEVPGWYGRGRPGKFGPVGVLAHHTGSYDKIADARDDFDYAGWLAKIGRPDLPAPLCQIALSREGVVYLCASGRANHAGTAKASGSVAAGDGNALYIGIEAMNDGSQGWDRSQYDAYVRLAAALCLDVTGNSVNTVRAHKETSTSGKWDPGLLDMGRFRADVQAQITAWTTDPRRPVPTPEEELDMDIETLQKAVAQTPLTVIGKKGEPLLRWPLERVLRHIEEEQDVTQRAIADLIAEVRSLKEQLSNEESE